MKPMDKPVVHIHGNNNVVEVKVIVTETPSKNSVAIAITVAAIVIASVLAVSLCCPELLADFVLWIVSTAIGG